MIILDTNVISELMRPKPDARVVAWVDRQADSTVYLTALTLAEIRFGIAALPQSRRRAALGAAFEDQIRPEFGDRILAFDETASEEYAVLRASARDDGRAISEIDAQIAAIALSRGFHVATRDVAPFESAGLDVVDPFERD